MSISVRIPTVLRSYTGGAPEVTAEPGTLREVISHLDAAHPGARGNQGDGNPRGVGRLNRAARGNGRRNLS